MTTELQIAANRENSLLGGVKTEEGKNRTRFNALKHGVLGNLITEYDKEFYKEILDDLIQEIQPVNSLEQILVERIAVSYLRLFRLSKAENEYMRSVLNPRITKDVAGWAVEEKIEVVNEGYVPALTQEGFSKMGETYLRYETSVENKLYRAIGALVNLRREQIGFVSQNEVKNGD